MDMLVGDVSEAFDTDDFFSFDCALRVIEPVQLDVRTSAVPAWIRDFDARQPRPADAAPDASDEDRKIRRMARNRRAAATSRSRKREHVHVMQSEINKLLDANDKLRNENMLLRRMFAGHSSGALQV